MGIAELERALETPTTGVKALERDLEKAPPLTTGQKIVRGSAGSIIGGALGGVTGAVVGSAVPVVGTAAGALTGTMLGSAAGEAVTQYLDPFKSGVEDASNIQIAIAGLLPAVPTLARRFFLSLPGAASGLQQFLFRQLGDKGERVVAKFAPVAGTADDLFREARQLGHQIGAVPGAIGGNAIPLSRTTQVAKEITEEVAKSKFATGASTALATRAQAFVKQNQVPFDEFRLNQSDVGALVRATQRKGGTALGRIKQLYAAMWDDLDTALATQAQAGNPVGVKLTQAIDAFKREEAAKFVKEWWLKSTVRRVGQANLDVDSFITKIDRHRDVLAKLMPAGEIDDLIQTLATKPLGTSGIVPAKVPTLAKTPQFGFEQVTFGGRKILGGALGAITGVVAGGGVGGAAGGAVGGVLAVEALSSALSTGPGRAFVRMMAERGMGWNQIGNVLLQGGRSAMTPDTEARVNFSRETP